jgi:hypothetical protein
MQGLLKGAVFFAVLLALAFSGVFLSHGVDLGELMPFARSSSSPMQTVLPAAPTFLADVYPALLRRARLDPAHADYSALRQAFAETPGYLSSAMTSPAADLEVAQDLKRGELNAVLVQANRLLDADWTDVRAHMALADAAALTDDQFNLDLHSQSAMGLLRAIVGRSDGHSPGEAYVVLDLSEEQAVLDSLLLSVSARTTIHDNGHTYHRLDTVDADDQHTVLYFNVDAPADAQERMLRPAASGGLPQQQGRSLPTAAVLPQVVHQTYAQAVALAAGNPNAADYQVLREGYGTSAAYDPLRIAGLEEGMLDALDTADGQDTAAARAHAILALDPADFYAHRVLYSVARSHSDADQATLHKQAAFGLLRAMLVSGDGRTPATAWHLLEATEVQAVLTAVHLSMKSEDGVSSAGHAYERVDVVDAQGTPSQVWFDLDVPVHWMLAHVNGGPRGHSAAPP